MDYGFPSLGVCVFRHRLLAEAGQAYAISHDIWRRKPESSSGCASERERVELGFRNRRARQQNCHGCRVLAPGHDLPFSSWAIPEASGSC
jgi:hypothetical protein